LSNWIQLRSGNGYDFDTASLFGAFSMEEDLAKSLKIPRFAGHLAVPWSVACHSVAVARTIEAVTGNLDAAAAGLLHDAHEAIMGDLPTPVAWAIDYMKVKAVKADIQAAIHDRLEIPSRFWPENHKEAVDLADVAALHIEYRMWMKPAPRDWGIKDPPHEWLLAMHTTIHDVVDQIQGDVDHDDKLFAREYRRLILDAAPYRPSVLS
jgi:hypothetical protein